MFLEWYQIVGGLIMAFAFGGLVGEWMGLAAAKSK